MRPRPESSGRPLAIHAQRNISSSLLQQRCRERFAEILGEYEEEVGYPVEWAIIYESGRANKMLLVTIFEDHEDFPLPVTESESETESQGECEGEDEDEEPTDGHGESKDGEGEVYDRKDVAKDDGEASGKYEGMTKGEIKEMMNVESRKMKKAKDRKLRKLRKLEEAKGAEGHGVGYEAEHEANKESKRRVVDATGKRPLATSLYTTTEAYQLTLNADGTENAPDLEDATDSTQKRNKNTETYEVVGTIRNGNVEWMCHDPRYSGFVDMTTYFHKDGLSMVHGLRIHDRIKERGLAELRRETEEKKAAKKERRKAGPAPDQSVAEKETADRKREKARAKRLRQKQNRALYQESAAEEEKAAEKAVNQQVMVVDPNTPGGAETIRQARKRGLVVLRATPID